MIYKMYSIKDELNGFAPAIPILSEELAKRYLKDHVCGNPTVKNTPEDFSLWEMGEFNTETGEYKDLAMKKLVERAGNYVSSKESNV